MAELTTAVIIPVRGHDSLLAGCLDALRAQTKPIDVIVVVDDSTDRSLMVPDGVTVVRTGGVGPYAARNLGWRSVEADLVLFTDARNRPRGNWVEEMCALFTSPTVAFAGSDTRVLDGPSWAARVAHSRQIFAVDNYVERSAFKVYFPTCNLAVRRNVLEYVNGFAVVRSGADADLCWRILQDESRTFAVTRETLMDWIPRDGLLDVIEQFHRYGKSNWSLRRSWQGQGAVQVVPTSLTRSAVRMARLFGRLVVSRARQNDDATLEQLVWATQLAFATGLRLAQLREQSVLLERRLKLLRTAFRS
jgi:glycosyltransferase involved in cell wall biosynthesis